MFDGWQTGTGRVMFGRKQITIPEKEITASNVLDILHRVDGIHFGNEGEISYLYDYYKGRQPILNRTKDVRPEICNKVVENRANEIVSFKTGYLCGEPIQYVSKDTSVENINTLNDYMDACDKAASDQEIIEWQMICGTAYRLVLPSQDDTEDSPFQIYTLDPRSTFVVYSNDIYHTPMMGVTIVHDEHDSRVYTCYTKDACYTCHSDSNQVQTQRHVLGMVPIFEYPANNSRLGSFEIVLPLLDQINSVGSNRMDGLEQTIQAFLKFVNCDITAEDFEKLKDLGAIKVKSTDGLTPDVDVVETDVDQNQTQTLKEDLYDAVLSICGMPNRNGGSSTSDTGAAVVLRDGWSLAESRAKDSERVFKKAEKRMLKLVLAICKESGLDIPLKDIDIQFTRRNYDNLQSKSQVLVSMLQQSQIHPQLAFQHCGMFADPESAYAMSAKWAEEQEKKALEQQEQQLALSAKYSNNASNGSSSEKTE